MIKEFKSSRIMFTKYEKGAIWGSIDQNSLVNESKNVHLGANLLKFLNISENLDTFTSLYHKSHAEIHFKKMIYPKQK